MKTLKWLAMPLLALALTSTFSACSDSKGDEEDGGEGGGLPAGALTPEENKERLSEIGNEFVKLIPASDFNELDQLATHIKNTYCESDYQMEALDEWAEDCFDALIETTWSESPTGYTTYNYTRRTYMLSQFRAHLNYNENTRRWDVQTGTSDLQATCKDQNGQTVVAKLTTSGKTKRVYIGEIEMTTYENDQAYAEIPEKINITLTRGSQTLVNVEVTTDLSTMTTDSFDLSKDAASVTLKAQLAGYDIQCQQLKAQANNEKGAVVSFFIIKNGKKLLGAEVTGTAGLPSGLVWGEYTDDDAFEEKLENFTGKVTYCKVDILGQLQVMATCSDAKKIYDAFEKADENKRNADIVNSCAQDANNYFSAQFFYDYGNSPQGHMELEATPNEKGEKYYIEPVIVFPDGSRYNMTNESYFNEENFKSLVDLFDNLCDSYEDMIEKYDDDDRK